MRPLFAGTLLLPLALSGAGPATAAPRRKAPPAPVKKAPPAPRPPLLESISVLPEEIKLSGPRAERHVLVTGRFSDGQERDVTGLAKFYSAAPKTARVDAGGMVTPAADGAAKIKAVVGKLAAWVPVTVEKSGEERPISFSDEVIPVLTKAGCNQGACHGSAAGKGGFSLSLLGYNPEADYMAVARQHAARRIQRSVPEDSLLLRKATLAIPHAGGMRFKPGSYEYNVLRQWIADGAPAPAAADPEIARVEALPPARVSRIKPGVPQTFLIPQPKGPARPVRWSPSQRLVALAYYKDGSSADVTRRAQFNTLNDGTAQVDSEGEVQVVGLGETSVMVRYRGAATVSRFTQPYREIERFPELAKAGFVDERVQAKWKEMGLLPSARCTDAEFMRRVYLDVLGTLPQPDEVRTFLASSDPDKRKKLVDTVLQRPEYVDYWTLKWGDLLRNNSDKVQPKGMWSFYNWLRACLRENKPADQFARELITAQGSAYTTGPANYFRVASNPADLAETTSQVFLGVRLTCAKCHHHPFEKWSQDDYWQMAAFFSRVGLKGSQEFGLFGGEQVVRLNPTGEVSNPRTGKLMKPTPLDGEPVEDPVDRRRALARWMTAPENKLFARNIVNRYWGYLLGRGIVEPIDDMRVTNPPSNPELLDALAADFIQSKYDFKHLIRTIVTSETYQLSANPTPENKYDEVFYTKYTAKRLSAEELLDAVNFATGTTEKFQSLPAGMRAIQLPDPNVPNYFLDTFGRPPRTITCECERSVEPNMAQALHLMNSDFVQNKVAAKDGRLGKLLAANKKDEEVVEELYLVTFSRPPTADETANALNLVAQAPSKNEGMEDLLWALLNSREFLFKH